MSKIREILRVLFHGGLSYRQVGLALGVSHNTVRRYDRLRHERNIILSEVDKMDDLALDQLFNASRNRFLQDKALPDFEYIHFELKKTKGVTVELLWQEYKENNPEGYSYTHFARLYRSWSNKLNLTMRQDHRAGEKLFLDYSGSKIKITNIETGEIGDAEIFVAVLGASSKTYVEASRSQKEEDWLQSNANALAYFGGVPTVLVPDNLKSAVIFNNKDKIKLNPKFIDFARHYGTVIIPARPRKPKDKAKVEAAVRIARTWILARLRNKIFHSIAEANLAISELLLDFNNRKMKKVAKSRNELFESIDRPALRALPLEPYQYADWRVNVRVGLDYVVEYEKCWYMVPYSLVNQYVDMRITARTVEILFKNRRVACHARLFNEGDVARNMEHMPTSHQHHSEWSPNRLLAWAQSVGEGTEKLFLYLLQDKPHPESGFRTCIAIIKESKSHDLSRIESVSLYLLKIKSLTLTSFRSVLRTNADKIGSEFFAANDEAISLIEMPHENIRGADYFK